MQLRSVHGSKGETLLRRKLPSFSTIPSLIEYFCSQEALPDHTKVPPEGLWNPKYGPVCMRLCPPKSQGSC